jgi:replicative DNA helicase
MSETLRQVKTPPNDLEAERAVLGSILIDPETVGDIMELIKSEDFYHEKHKAVFRAMESLYEKAEPIDLVTLSDSLRKESALEKVGGELFIAQLADGVPTSAHSLEYARLVREKSILRNLITTGSKIVENAYSLEEVDVILDQAERAILRIGERTMDRSFRPLKTIIDRAFDKLVDIKIKHDSPEGLNYVSGIPTGYKNLDTMTTGFHKSDLVIVAARPSMGKSALALNFAHNISAKFGYKVGIFSLEMSAEQIALRLLSLDSRVPFSKLRKGDITNDEWDRLTHAASRLTDAKLIIDDDSMLEPRTLRTKARRIKKEYGLDAVVIDYMQLMNCGKDRENRQQEISEISRSLKLLGKELDIAVIAASQLSRSIEQREDKRPRLSDLRESGAIEQDADMVLFIHREAYYKRKKESSEESEIQMLNEPHEAEVIIGKQRNGPIGTIRLTFDPNFVSFYPIDYGFQIP